MEEAPSISTLEMTWGLQASCEGPFISKLQPEDIKF
jgi:hypothetical protein